MATILLADDEEIFCSLLEGILSSHGHSVMTANNGRDAFKLYQQHHPQITVLDLRMPEMDGLEVLRQIHAIEPKAAVMMLTAWGTDELEQQARQYGALDFLSKDLTYDSIATVVENVGKTPSAVPGSVLLVTDDDESRGQFEPFLRDHGVAIRAARDSNEALSMIGAEMPQLIVLDMDLTRIEDPWGGATKLTAPEFLHALHRIHYPGRLILMSNVVDHAVEAQIHTDKMQAVDHLQKPVTSDRLLVAIQITMPPQGTK